MNKIPLNEQIESTRTYSFLTPEFCQKVLRGLCMTKVNALYFEHFPKRLHTLGFFIEHKREKVYKELTYGELCASIYEFIDSSELEPDGYKKDLSKFASYPFVETSHIDIKYGYTSDSDSTDKAAYQSRAESNNNINRPCLFNPEIQDKMYGLSRGNFDARYFYWLRYMTKKQFFDAVIALTNDSTAKELSKKYCSSSEEAESRMLYIGHDLCNLLKSFEEIEDYNNEYEYPNYLRNINNFNRIIKDFIIYPISIIYNLIKGEISNESKN